MKTDIFESQTISPDTLRTQYVNPGACIFSMGETGFLKAVIDGVEYKRVILSRSLPLNFPDDYICITDTEKKELGIIEHISQFDEGQQALINDELGKRYFCPVITSIDSIKDKMGNFYFDVKIGTFEKQFTVKDITRSIRQQGKSIYLTDIDGNRYKIEDYSKIPSKSRHKLEPYLY